jgi:hypothetical protein
VSINASGSSQLYFALNPSYVSVFIWYNNYANAQYCYVWSSQPNYEKFKQIIMQAMSASDRHLATFDVSFTPSGDCTSMDLTVYR